MKSKIKLMHFILLILFVITMLIGCANSKAGVENTNAAIAARTIDLSEAEGSDESSEDDQDSENEAFEIVKAPGDIDIIMAPDDINYENVKPAVDISYKTVTVCDGAVTIDIPDALVYEEPFPGSENFTYGFLHDEDGEEHYCKVYVTRIFQEEDPILDINVLEATSHEGLVLIHGYDTDIQPIQTTTFDTNEVGFITRVSYLDGYSEVTRYLINIMSDGVFYQVNISSDTGLIQELVALKILHSVKIDIAREKEIVDAFKLDIRDNVYYSQRLEGASMVIPPFCYASEGFVLIFSNLIMNFRSDDNLGSVSVEHYDKAQNHSNNMKSMISTTIAARLNSGMVSYDVIEDIKYFIEPESNRVLLVYPDTNSYFYADLIAEYEDAFYVINMHYSEENRVYAEGILYACSTFQAPGTEIFQQ